MANKVTHKFMTEEVGKLQLKQLARIASGIELLSGTVPPALEKDEETNEYDLESYFSAQRNGKIYSTLIPIYEYNQITECTKADANANMVCKPSTAIKVGQDDYQGVGPFINIDVNATVDADGVPHTSAVSGDGLFDLKGSNGNVFVATPVLWWRWRQEGEYYRLSVTDTMQAGFSVQPGATLPDGSLRPYMLYAKYAGGKKDGKLVSMSGAPLWNYTYSHNNSHTASWFETEGLSGKTVADDWYLKVMFLLKYADKSSQTVFGGCSSYNISGQVTVAEENTDRVIMSNANAAKLLIGSCIEVGPSNGSNTIADHTNILKIEAYDDDNKAVYLDKEGMSVPEGTYWFTRPYNPGYCDSVLGRDGSPINPKNANEPFILQGIETMVGAYEILSDVIISAGKNSESDTCYLKIYRCYDRTKYSSSLTADYKFQYTVPCKNSAGSYYERDYVNVDGFLIPTGYDATSTTGLGDGIYQNAYSSQGLREWLGLGLLFRGSLCGLACVHSIDGLGSANWCIAGRLSALGRQAA